jgi:glycolate oxidase FAD binding subunit
VDAAFRCALAAAAAGGGAVVLESAPAWAKRGRDVFGDLAGALPLARELKRRFDPAGLLNPGRFAGHL